MPEGVKKVEIVGGGLAGLSAALVLGRGGARVVVYERRSYPRVKLCGEFLSPEGLAALCRVTGLAPELVRRELSLAPLRRFAWVTRAGRRMEVALEPEGWAVRRDVLDPWLAELARAAGAEVRIEEAAPQLGPLVLWATGKERRELESPYFAVKGYCRAAADVLDGVDIALYQLRGGYIGFTRMHGGELSYCALLHRKRVEASWRYARWADLVDGVFGTNRELAHWTRDAESLLANHVGSARFDFRHYGAVREGRWFAGDAVQLVPPFVGDGMATAIESGELAAAAILAGARDAEYERAWRRRFGPRMRVANVLHPLLWLRSGHESAISVLSRLPAVPAWIYRQTRGPCQPSGPLLAFLPK